MPKEESLTKIILTPETLVGMDLNSYGFQVKEMFEIYSTDEKGRFVASLGLYHSETIAEGLVEARMNSACRKVTSQRVLTNGEVAFAIGRSIDVMSDEEAKLEVAKVARLKLGDAMAEALGIISCFSPKAVSSPSREMPSL